MSIPLIPSGNQENIELQIIIAMLDVDPFYSDENGRRCIYCGSDYHLNSGQHFYECPYAAAQDYVSRALAMAEKDQEEIRDVKQKFGLSDND